MAGTDGTKMTKSKTFDASGLDNYTPNGFAIGHYVPGDTVYDLSQCSVTSADGKTTYWDIYTNKVG